MPLFGKKEKKIDIPEVVDFSNDTWSYKGEAPVYQIQSDGFSYDIVDSDGNDKNAISLGIAGMIIIVLNAKSPKIREDELLPQFGKVIKTRNWHSMTVKEANFLVQTAIKKLSSSASSGDVFDLASYAPLEVKRVLLKTLFTISRTQMAPEYREEAEHRIIDDIVPDIFSNPAYELALLTGLIVKPDEKTPENSTSTRIETTPILDPDQRFSTPFPVMQDPAAAPSSPVVEEDSAFAELQKIYGRRSESSQVRAVAAQRSFSEQESSSEAADSKEAEGSVQNFVAPQPFAQVEPKSIPQPAAPDFSTMSSSNPFTQAEPKSIPQPAVPNFSAPQPNNPFVQSEAQSIPQPSAPNFSAPQPNNPFVQSEAQSIPQPSAPNFSAPQPNNPFANAENSQYYQQQNGNIPQPPMPNYGMQPGMNPYAAQNMQQNVPYPQMNQYIGNFQPYPGQRQMPQQMPQYPQQMWQQMQQNPQGQMNQQIPQNYGGYPQNPMGQQMPDGQNQMPYQGWQGYPMNYPQQPMQAAQNNQAPSSQNNENA